MAAPRETREKEVAAASPSTTPAAPRNSNENEVAHAPAMTRAALTGRARMPTAARDRSARELVGRHLRSGAHCARASGATPELEEMESPRSCARMPTTASQHMRPRPPSPSAATAVSSMRCESWRQALPAPPAPPRPSSCGGIVALPPPPTGAVGVARARPAARAVRLCARAACAERSTAMSTWDRMRDAHVAARKAKKPARGRTVTATAPALTPPSHSAGASMWSAKATTMSVSTAPSMRLHLPRRSSQCSAAARAEGRTVRRGASQHTAMATSLT
mmetsp:Transcript_10316/g.30618  ORF Transcript_10316/g.30618 Transcript_10316/m.30618 type:complete len:277 (-) Transcript_10316:606-1436(-)